MAASSSELMTKDQRSGKYDITEEISKIVSFRRLIEAKAISEEWDKLTLNQIDLLPKNNIELTSNENDSYQKILGSTKYSEIKHISKQEEIRRFRRWKIERSISHNGSIRKKYQDLSKYSDGKYGYLGSAPYIEFSNSVKLPMGWEKFSREEKTQISLEKEILAAQASTLESSALIEHKKIFCLSAENLPKYTNLDIPTKQETSASSHQNLSHLPPKPSTGALRSNSEVKDTVSNLGKTADKTENEVMLRLKLKKKMEEKNREKAIKKSKLEVLQEVTMDEAHQVQDDTLSTHLQELTHQIRQIDDPKLQINSSFPLYSDHSPNGPELEELYKREYSPETHKYQHSSVYNPNQDFDEIDACYTSGQGLKKSSQSNQRGTNVTFDRPSSKISSSAPSNQLPPPPPLIPPPPPPSHPRPPSYPVSQSNLTFSTSEITQYLSLNQGNNSLTASINSPGWANSNFSLYNQNQDISNQQSYHPTQDPYPEKSIQDQLSYNLNSHSDQGLLYKNTQQQSQFLSLGLQQPYQNSFITARVSTPASQFPLTQNAQSPMTQQSYHETNRFNQPNTRESLNTRKSMFRSRARNNSNYGTPEYGDELDY